MADFEGTEGRCCPCFGEGPTQGRQRSVIQILSRFFHTKKSSLDAGICHAEADAIEEAMNNKIEKGPWLDLFVSTK